MYFDSEANWSSAYANIFATKDESGNGEKIGINIEASGKKIVVSPQEGWPEGAVYIFMKESMYDKSGNRLGKNLKYKLNIRGNVYDK